MRITRTQIIIWVGVGIATGFYSHILAQKSHVVNDGKVYKLLDPDRIDRALLEGTIITITNLIREQYSVDPCLFDSNLVKVARAHSEEMVRLRYFNHGSPVPENRQLLDRIKNSNITLGNTIVGENIGVDYLLDIANVPYYIEYDEGKKIYISGETGQPIGYQSYWEFARSMVQSWIKSPGHRENILNEQFGRIGIGAAVGTFKGFRSIYITQNFLGSLKSKKSHAH